MWIKAEAMEAMRYVDERIENGNEYKHALHGVSP